MPAPAYSLHYFLQLNAHKIFRKISLLLFLAVVGEFCLSRPSRAQIVPDNTLAPDRSVVTTPNTANEFQVTGGTQINQNLFHSFEIFSIPEGGGVTFINDNPQINNILSRVTGSAISNINGYINSGGNAPNFNLFIINPNGIIFGSGAALNLGGSFFASTAESIVFNNNIEFSATNPTQPLLTIDLPLGLQFGEDAGKISLQQTQIKVTSGHDLGLISGEIEANNTIISATNGRLELGGVGSNSFVNITANESGWYFDYQSNNNWGNIKLLNNSLIGTETTENDDRSNIWVVTGNLQIVDSQVLSTTEKESGLGSILSIEANNSVEISGKLSEGFPAGIFMTVNGSEDGGEISLRTNKLTLRDGGQISTLNSNLKIPSKIAIEAKEISILGLSGIYNRLILEEGNNDGKDKNSSGNIQIDTEQLFLSDGGQISASTFGAGDAGKIIINVANTLTIANKDILTFDSIFSGIFAQVMEDGKGNGGDIDIEAAKITLQSSGSIISATTFGEGNGGNVLIDSQEIYLSDGAQIQAATIGKGIGGTITINADRILSLSGFSRSFGTPSGLVTSTDIDGNGVTLGTAKAGDLNITTDKLIVTDGGIISASTSNLGQGGTIDIDANTIIIKGEIGNYSGDRTQNSGLFVRAFDSGNAGDINIKTDNLFLDSQGGIIAETNSSNGGNISLNVDRVFTLRNGSTISTTAGIDEAFGNGGNIKIHAGFIVTLPQENSDIIANAFRGNGGNITIATRAIFGFDSRGETTNKSDISSSSRLGVQGQIEIETPEIDSSQGLILLSQQAIDTSESVTQSCTNSNFADNRLILLERGGLPPQPQDIGFYRTIAEDLGDFEQLNSQNSTIDFDTNRQDRISSYPTIVEAKGWIVDRRGNIILTATDRNLYSYSTLNPTSFTCLHGQ
jgi:filamentous hemagglutinin family protein